MTDKSMAMPPYVRPVLAILIIGTAVWIGLDLVRDHIGRPAAWGVGLVLLILAIVGLTRGGRRKD